MSLEQNPDTNTLEVIALSEADSPAATALAEQLRLPVAQTTRSTTKPLTHWQLQVDNKTLTLVRPDGARLSIDFTQGTAAQRRAQASKDQSLVRALGLHKLNTQERHALRVVDATAGLGQDGWLIACQGCQTTMLEQSPLVATLLQHAVTQATTHDELGEIAKNITVLNIRSQDYFATAQPSNKADIIYLDPMFPPKKKQAKVKKGMQFLQALLDETDNAQLLQCALAAANKRVVVKRPTGALAIEGSEVWKGQLTNVQTDATRFDIYHIAPYSNQQGGQ